MSNNEFKILLFSVISEDEIRGKHRHKMSMKNSNWATGSSEYHKNCRKELLKELEGIENVIKFIDDN